ncbi:MAG TPA: hypothetical protein VFV17_01590 [Usitatibacteraceae bacterium]|nr:hypothetical protein [Usitatibacteraceae bacterium]
MIERLERLSQLRGKGSRVEQDADFARRLHQLKVWQNARLARTYADLSADPRHAAAVGFFLDHLYGDADANWRDRDLMRMMPTMRRLLPDHAYETVDRALALDVISEEFDQAMTDAIGDVPIDEAAYARAFRRVGRIADRREQVRLMRAVGEGLDEVVDKPVIYTTLKWLRKPARLAGLGEMQAFLEAGFTAFRTMAGAEHFLSTIEQRELALIDRLATGQREPFAVIPGWTGGADAATGRATSPAA